MGTFETLFKREKELRKEHDNINNQLAEATGQEFETLLKRRKEVVEELDRIDSTFCHGLWNY